MYKVVIVDDEKIIRETIHSLINWEEYDLEVVGTCADGISALDCIMDEYPDIVLTDIRMPGMSGLDLIRRVQELALNVEFIILSGYSEFEFARTAMKYGVKHYLLKPCNENEIVRIMELCKMACKENLQARLDAIESALLSSQYSEELQNHYWALLLTVQDTAALKARLVQLAMKALDQNSQHFTHADFVQFLLEIQQKDNLLSLQQLAENILTAIFHPVTRTAVSDCVKKTLQYVQDHLEDSDLSLKWLAENYLYMDPDYISKQFIRQTGQKFSAYVTSQRIEKAKQIMTNNPTLSQEYIAEHVGFGNNPRYFSQVFKKYTSVSPQAWMNSLKANST